MKILISLFAFILSFLIVNSCSLEPVGINVQSGSVSLGSFSPSNSIYIKDNFEENPLKIEFVFENSQEECLTQVEQVQLRLFPTGALLDSNAVSTQLDSSSGLYITKAYFEFDFASSLPSAFTSEYFISSSESQISQGTITFIIDNAAPTIHISKTPSDNFLAPNTSINIVYEIADSGAGLKSILVNSQRIMLTGNKTYSGVISENLFNSKTFSIEAEDMLGFKNQAQVSFKIDNTAPVISNIIKSYTFDGEQKISFSIDVTDDSFNNSDFISVIGLFGQINSDYENGRVGNCVRQDNFTYTCSWNNLVIDLEETKRVNVGFIAFDQVGNNNTITRQEEIFIDNDGPKIVEFYTQNELGVKNVFSANSKEVLIKLELEDDSLILNPDFKLTLFERFDKIPRIEPFCTKVSKRISCVYNITNYLNLYSSEESKTLQFDLVVTDVFSNPSQKTINVTLDNTLPIITNIELIETQAIKDGIVTSGEVINFRLLIEEDNLFDVSNHFVYGDFSLIDFREGQENKKAVCSRFNQTHTRCDFNGIRAENGYFLRNVSFYVSDIAGNSVTESKEVEVLKIGDEVVSSYRIRNIDTLNPLNRNVALKSSSSAWFEGKLELVDPNPEIRLVNFQIQSCNERGLNPILVIDYQMFPQDIVIARNSEKEMGVTLRVDLRDHNNINDLNDKTMNCTVSILKRDDTQIYPPELVTFNLNFKFFDLPRGSLLEAHAQNVLDMIDEAMWLGDWFDSLYGIYSLLDNICTVVNTGTGLITTISNAWYYMSVALKAFPATEEMTIPINEGIFNLDGTFSKILFDDDSYIRKACDWVTCRNGGHLLGAMNGSIENIPGISTLSDLQNEIAQFSCTLFSDVFSGVLGEE